MIKTAALLLVIALRLIYQPSEGQQVLAPFSGPQAKMTGIAEPAALISFNGTIWKNKVILEWIVSENEMAYQFEVEKSTDGKIFQTTAFVFGTDRPQTGQYRFTEKAVSRTLMYRVKMISKNQKTDYSPVITIHNYS